MVATISNKYAAMLLCPLCKLKWAKVLNKRQFVVCCTNGHIWNWCSVHNQVALGRPAERSLNKCSCLSYDEDRTV